MFSPSPRDMPEIYEALKGTGYDRLYSKYFTEEIAYNLGRDFFLEHKEYTHFVICPDDLLVEKKHIDALVKNLENNDYLVHAGVCNVDTDKNKDKLCIAENLPHPIKMVKASSDGTGPTKNLLGWRCYMWVSSDHDFGERPIRPFYFSGFAAQFIDRQIMEALKFEDDSKVNHTPHVTGGSLDVIFSNKMYKLNISQMIDTRVRMKHIRSGEENPVVNLGDGEVRFYRANEDDYELVYAEPKGIKRKWMKVNDKIIGQIKDQPNLPA